MSLPENVVAAIEDYPLSVKLQNETDVELCPATPDDKDSILAFADGLDEQDLLFLRVDITEPQAVENWLANVGQGETISILAWQDGQVVGYCSVDRTPARWTRRVGEIRVNVAPSFRGQGLGRHLTAKVFDVARRVGLKKLVANMTPDQLGAQNAFSRLGFRPEAVLADHIEDRDGGIHDLTIMSYSIDGLSSRIDSPLKV